MAKRMKGGEKERSSRTASASDREPRCGRWSNVVAATEQLVMASLDLAESATRDFPEEVEKIRRVRRLVEARFAGEPAPRTDPRDLAFTIGLVATLADSHFGREGIASLLVDLFPLAVFTLPGARLPPRWRH